MTLVFRHPKSNHERKRLVVDGKTIYVFPSSKIPKSVYEILVHEGIELLPATWIERKPFLEHERNTKRNTELHIGKQLTVQSGTPSGTLRRIFVDNLWITFRKVRKQSKKFLDNVNNHRRFSKWYRKAEHQAEQVSVSNKKIYSQKRNTKRNITN